MGVSISSLILQNALKMNLEKLVTGHNKAKVRDSHYLTNNLVGKAVVLQHISRREYAHVLVSKYNTLGYHIPYLRPQMHVMASVKELIGLLYIPRVLSHTLVVISGL